MSIRCFLLATAAAAFMAACGESKPPAAPATTAAPAQSAPALPQSEAPAPPASPAAEPAVPPAEEAKSTTPPVASAQPPKNLAARKLDPEKIKRGEAVYHKNCASCHGPNGEATPGWRNPGPDGRYPPPPLDGSAHAWHHSTETLERMIRLGSPDGAGGMPAWDGRLTNQEIDDVIVWIKSLWPDEVYDIWYKEIEVKPEPKQK